jgi:hypothetical protein
MAIKSTDLKHPDDVYLYINPLLECNMENSRANDQYCTAAMSIEKYRKITHTFMTGLLREGESLYSRYLTLFEMQFSVHVGIMAGHQKEFYQPKNVRSINSNVSSCLTTRILSCMAYYLRVKL